MASTSIYASVLIGLRYAKIKQQRAYLPRFLAFINFFSVLGLTLGVMSLIVVMAVMSGLEGQLKDRMLNLVPHVIVESDIPLVLDPNLVREQTQYHETQALLQTQSDLSGIVIQGMSTEALQNELALPDFIVAGQFNDFDAPFQMIIGAALARKLNVTVGEKVRLIIPSQSRFTPFGRIPLQRLVTVQAIYQMQTNADDYMVFMPLTTVQKFTRNTPITQRLFLHDAFMLQPVEQWLTDYSYSTWREREGAFFDAVRMEKNMMSLMLSLIIAIAAFNIIVALVMLVNEKNADIAVLRTQGMRKSAVMLVFMITGLTNSLKGTLLGCILGVVTVLLMNPVLIALNAPISLAIDGTPVPFVLHWQDVIAVVIGAVTLCLLATILPSLRALNINPATALASE